MRLSQFIEREPSKRRKSSGKTAGSKASLATHGAFVPIVTLWGAALLGLAVMVLPELFIARINAVSGLGMGGLSRFLFAGIATLLGGALAFVVAGALRSKALHADSSRPLVSAVNARRVRPIDPASELGSESLDAPLEEPVLIGKLTEEGEDWEEDPKEETIVPSAASISKKSKSKPEPTLGELSQRGYDIEAPEPETDRKGKPGKDEPAFTHKQFRNALIESCEGASCEAASEARNAASVAAKPRRTVAEVASKHSPATVASTREPVPASALEKLRQTPTDELSLVEMVERFAGALHEHQQSERARQPGGVGRDAALAEALKALTLFTEKGFDQESRGSLGELGKAESDLRDALAKLQVLRGAA